jgi:hypothetical protein
MGEAAEKMEETVSTLAPTSIVHVLTSRAVLMKQQIEAETELRKLVAGYVRDHMVRDTDYGVVKGTDRNTLLKPGAEKLVDLFRAIPEYEVTDRVQDWDKPLFHYEFRCVLKDDSGRVLAVGVGSANSREGKYRWRNADRTCPECGKPTILKSKRDPEWFCWEKRGGCGATFDIKDPRVVDQVTGKVENDDIYTQVNTLLKMAKKRALVDAAIALARCSDMFTQDMDDEIEPSDAGAERPGTAAKPQASSAKPASRNGKNGGAKMPYGDHKGKLVTDPSVPTKDLNWMAERMRDALHDDSKKAYYDQNKALLEALQTELLNRAERGDTGGARTRARVEDDPHGRDDRPPPPDDDDIPF